MTDPLAEIGSLSAVDFDAGALFSGQPSGRQIKGYAAPCRHTPAIDPDYLFPATMRDLVVWFMGANDSLYLFGPTGSGKTSLVRQVAARLNYRIHAGKAVFQKLHFSPNLM